MNRSEKATAYFRNNFNCSQSVLTVFGPDYGVSEDSCLRLSCAFGGGMGRKQLTCGAVTGALMVLGLRYGKAAGDPDEKKQETYEKTREFISEFEKIHGSSSCHELLDRLDLNNPDDHRKITELGFFQTRCEKFVSDAVKIVEKMVL